MTYRQFIADDFEQLYAIEEVCFEPPERFSRRYMRQLVNAARSATWVATEDERLSGFAIVQWGHQEAVVEAYIQTIEVSPEWRRRGIAGELLGRAEGSVRASGAVKIWLHVEERNRAAIGLYQAHGYLCEGRHEGYYGSGRAALIYEKSLLADDRDVDR